MIRTISLIFLALISTTALLAQSSEEKIDKDLVEPSRILKILAKEGITHSGDIGNLGSTCAPEPGSGNFNYHLKNYIIKAPIQEVWDAYKHINPAEAWCGKIGSFAFMYSRYSGELSYIQDEFSGIQVGQMIFLNLKFLGGLFNLAVGQEVMEVNEKDYHLRFCYLENGKSAGSQNIYLSSTPENYTRVTHLTSYKSDSPFRDEKLYPVIHSMIIREFHSSVAEFLSSRGKDFNES